MALVWQWPANHRDRSFFKTNAAAAAAHRLELVKLAEANNIHSNTHKDFSLRHVDGALELLSHGLPMCDLLLSVCDNGHKMCMAETPLPTRHDGRKEGAAVSFESSLRSFVHLSWL